MSPMFSAMSQNADKSFKNMETSAKRASEKFRATASFAASGIGTVGAGLAAGGGAILYGLADATKQAAAFYKRVDEVSTLIKGMSVKEVEQQFGPMLLKMSEAYGQSAEVMTKAAYQAISAGVDPTLATVKETLDVASRAAIAGVSDVETSINGLTSVINAYGKQNMSAKTAADMMFQAVVAGKTTFQELSKSLFQVIPLAAATGVSFRDVTAAIASMTAQGTPTSVATTQLRQAIVELSKSTTATSKIFRQTAGVSFIDFMKKGNSLADVLGIMEKASQKSGKRMIDMFGSVEAGNAAMQLTGAGAQVFSKNISGAADSVGAADVAFEKMSTSAAFRIEQLNAKMDNLKISVGEKLLPTLEKVAPKFVEIVDKFSVLVDQEKIEGIGKIALGMVGVGTGLGAVAVGLGIVGRAAALAGTLAVPLGAVLGTALLIPIALAAVGTAAYQLYSNWDNLKTSFGEMTDYIGEALSTPLSERNEKLKEQGRRFRETAAWEKQYLWSLGGRGDANIGIPQSSSADFPVGAAMETPAELITPETIRRDHYENFVERIIEKKDRQQIDLRIKTDKGAAAEVETATGGIFNITNTMSPAGAR